MTPRYVGVFDRGYGQEAIEILLDYPFAGSGVLIPPTLTVNIDLGKSMPPYYMEVIFLACFSYEGAEKTFGIHDLSDRLARHKEVQRRKDKNERPTD